MDRTVEIRDRLSEAEREHGVRIIYACESGSRAWGFASIDSDYDARFLYLRPRDWYLSIDVERRRDVIELPIENDLDINGWDLRKALQLLRKSNPPLLEWLRSPIVYKQVERYVDPIRTVVPLFYNPRATRYHYFHMASGNAKKYLQGPEVAHKKYFYVLRPIFAIRWIERFDTAPPMEFAALMKSTCDSGPLREAVDDLLRRKRAAEEMASAPAVPAISDFISEELSRLEHEAPPPARGSSPDVLDDLFRRLIALNETDDAAG